MTDENEFIKLPIQVYIRIQNENEEISFVKIPLPFYVKYARKSNNTRKVNSYNSLKSMYVKNDADLSNVTEHCYNDILTILTDQILSLTRHKKCIDQENEAVPECTQENANPDIGLVDIKIEDDHSDDFDDDSLVDKGTDTDASPDIVSIMTEEYVSKVPRSRDKLKMKIYLAKKSKLNLANRFKCDDCDMSYKNKSGLQRHKMYLCSVLPPDILSRNKQRDVCKECGKSFLFKHVLDNHMAVKHMRIKPYKCDMCPKAYYTNTSLLLHVNSTHSSGFNHICENCGKGFKTSDAIRHHIRTVHVVAELKCPMCPAVLKTQSNLRSHMKIHERREKRFMCEVCSKSFTEACRLRRHMGTHGGAKNNTCPDCGKQFLAAYNLRVHMRVHSGEKPYQCDVCQRCFSQSVGLKVHICHRKTKEQSTVRKCPRPSSGATESPMELPSAIKCDQQTKDPTSFAVESHACNNLRTLPQHTNAGTPLPTISRVPYNLF